MNATASTSSSLVRILQAPLIERPDLGLMQTAAATKTAWGQFKDETSRATGRLLRDTFFFPIPLALTGKNLLQQQSEQAFFNDFFDSSKSLDPNFPDQAKIRESFRFFDQKISAVLPDGRNVLFTLRIIETKDSSSEETYHAAMVLGNASTHDNNASGPYPFLASFLDQNLDSKTPKTGRFFLISQYSMELVQEDQIFPYKAETFDEAGYVLVQLLAAIKETYGKIDQLVAHSIGCAVFAAALKDLTRNKELVPHHLHLDRGPSSIENTSRNYLGGALLLALAESSGWSVDVANEVSTFCNSYSDREIAPSIVISGVVDDYFFPGIANLALNEQIAQLQTANKISVFYFKIPWQVFHERAHHSLRGDLLHKEYLTAPSSNGLEDGQRLVDFVVRRSYNAITDMTDQVA